MALQNFNWFLFNLLGAYFPSMFFLASVASPTDLRSYLLAPVIMPIMLIGSENPSVWFVLLGAFWGVLVVLSTSLRSLRARVIALTCLLLASVLQGLWAATVFAGLAGMAHS
jgi:hypothetical protein